VSIPRARYNLNTIRLPVGYWYFAKKAGLDPSPYIVPDEDLYDSDHPITNVIRWANQAGLAIIFVSEDRLPTYLAHGTARGMGGSLVDSIVTLTRVCQSRWSCRYVLAGPARRAFQPGVWDRSTPQRGLAPLPQRVAHSSCRIVSFVQNSLDNSGQTGEDGNPEVRAWLAHQSGGGAGKGVSTRVV
jgi:hypothetical protein